MIKISIKQADGIHSVALCMDYEATVTEDGYMNLILYADDNRKDMSHFFAEVATCIVNHLEEPDSMS